MKKIEVVMDYFKDTPGTFRFQVPNRDGSEPITDVYIKQFAAKTEGGAAAVKRIKVTIEQVN